jgi:hypothetical protein
MYLILEYLVTVMKASKKTFIFFQQIFQNTKLHSIKLRVIAWHSLVAHACNRSYSGDINQEDWDSKPAQANSLWDSISKIPSQKRAGRVAQGEGPEFKPQYQKRNWESYIWIPTLMISLCRTTVSCDNWNSPI